MPSLFFPQVSEEAILHPVDDHGKVPGLVERLLRDEPKPYTTAQLILALFEFALRQKAVTNLLRHRSTSKSLRKQIADRSSSFGQLPAKISWRTPRQVMRNFDALLYV